MAAADAGVYPEDGGGTFVRNVGVHLVIRPYKPEDQEIVTTAGSFEVSDLRIKIVN